MKIYVASSWRNVHQPKVVEVLRSAGHEVYDFRNPAPGNEGFSWRQVDPTYERGALVSAEHWRRLVDSPVALEGHAHDLGAMKWADACVYVLPCGRSASFEAGWFQGQGKRLVVVAFEPTEPELMFRDADIVGSLASMLDALAAPPAGVGAETGHQTGSAQLRCIAPLGDDDTVGPRCPGYCDVYEAGEGGRCTRVCAASRVDDGTEDAQADEDATLLNAGSGGSWSVMRGAPAGTGGRR